MSKTTPSLTPQQVSVLRGKISEKLSKNLTMAQEVLNGTREWNPTQARVFTALLNKVVPDVSLSFAQVDVQTKDMSRMYYVPSMYRGSYHFIFTHQGSVMEPKTLMEKHKYVEQSKSFFDRLPESIKKGMLEHKRNTLNNTNYTWTGYKDCPFVNKRQVDEFKGISGGGWYHKMYQMMVTIAGNAMSKGYPITSKEIEWLLRDLDNDTGGWYSKRPISKEAERAIEYVFKNNI